MQLCDPTLTGYLVTFVAEKPESLRSATVEPPAQHQRPASTDSPFPSQRGYGDGNAATIELQGYPDDRLSSDAIPPLNSLPDTIDRRTSSGFYTTPALCRGSESLSSHVNSPQSQRSQGPATMRPVETDPEVAFLLRHFSEQPGKW